MDNGNNKKGISWTQIGVLSQFAVWAVLAFQWFAKPNPQIATNTTDIALLKQSQSKQDEDIKTLQSQIIGHMEMDAKIQWEIEHPTKKDKQSFSSLVAAERSSK